MYMGVSWPVRSLNIAAGIVFIWICSEEKNKCAIHAKFLYFKLQEVNLDEVHHRLTDKINNNNNNDNHS